jgi:pyruvate dehydrogenase E1 component alpha subunit
VRSGQGPYFLEFKTYRFRAHSMFDPELYRAKTEVLEWQERGPIHTYSQRLKAAGLLDEASFEALDAQVAAEVEAAVAFAEAGTLEPVAALSRDLYTEEPSA